MALTLTGLTALQASLLSGAMELKESSFRRNVMSALSNASEDLALGEATTIFLSSTLGDSGVDLEGMVAVYSSDTSLDVSVDMAMDKRFVDLAPLRVVGDTIKYSVESPQRVRIAQSGIDGKSDSLLVDSFHTKGDYEIVLDGASRSRRRLSWVSESDSGHILKNHFPESMDFSQMKLTGDMRSDSGKLKLVARVMDNYINVERVPIEERLDSINVDSIVQATLDQVGVDLNFAYAIYVEPDDSARIVSDELYRNELADSDFRVRLFPQDVFAPPTHLALFFPGHRMFLWGQMTPMLGATAFLTLLIVASFGFSIRALNQQRRVSELMVDFINNMTHEFKTPISTISLAAEAIDRDEVVSSPEKIQRFNDMIKSEAARMRGQAERILQMAALEENTLELAPIEVDLHEALADAIRAVELHVSESGGTIEREFKATNPYLEADKVHLLNIAHNLLDNAKKYSDSAPHITVRTFDSDRGVGFRIEDEGIGIDVQSQKQVFDKYFRAPTGNVHNVKGFGLGLSYVKLIVEQHQGEITLHSVPGVKTEVEIILPRKQSGETS